MNLQPMQPTPCDAIAEACEARADILRALAHD